MHGLKFSHVYLDMDGVLADFYGELIKRLKLSYVSVIANWPAGEYYFPPGIAS
jgi:hypothetical protein